MRDLLALVIGAVMPTLATAQTGAPAPLPANRSRNRAPGRSGSRMAKSVSRMRSVAGRVVSPFGATRVRPFTLPAMILKRARTAARDPAPR